MLFLIVRVIKYVLRVKKCNLHVIKYCFIKSWIKIKFTCYKIVFACDKIGDSINI